MFYDMYVGEVVMSDSCSCIVYFRMSKGIGLSIPFSNFPFYWWILKNLNQNLYFVLGSLLLIRNEYVYTSFYVLIWKNSNEWCRGDYLVCQYVRIFISEDVRMRGNPHEFNYFLDRGDDVVDMINYLIRMVRCFDDKKGA
jgi:hypothetical protein